MSAKLPMHIAIRSFVVLPPSLSFIVYYKGLRISPGECAEDGFATRAEALKFLWAWVDKRLEAHERLVEAAENAQCDCTISQRDSGHDVECWMPDFVDALAASRAALDGGKK